MASTNTGAAFETESERVVNEVLAELLEGTNSELAESPQRRSEQPSRPQSLPTQSFAPENCIQSLTTMTPPKPFRFLSLPVEIRLMIYSLLLLFPEEWIPLFRAPKRDFSSSRKISISHSDNSKTLRSLSLAILRTCRQIQHEAAPILYGHHGFGKMGCTDLYFFTRNVGSRNASFIRQLASIELPCIDMCVYFAEKRVVVSRYPTQDFEEGCPNLEVIGMYWSRANWRFAKYVPMAELFEYFKAAVQHLKDAFPKLKRVLLPSMDRERGLTLSDEGQRYIGPDLRQHKSDETCIWGDICDFLEENGWVIGADD